MTKEDELKLKELYESTFGRKPSGKAKIETIIDRLKSEGVDVSDYVDEEPKKEVTEEGAANKLVVEKKAPETPLEETPVVLGGGLKARHLVYFKGEAKYWTAASIQAMRSYAKEIKFPEDTQYSDANNFSKCKTCG